MFHIGVNVGFYMGVLSEMCHKYVTYIRKTLLKSIISYIHITILHIKFAHSARAAMYQHSAITKIISCYTVLQDVTKKNGRYHNLLDF
jgi:hypothetical protein